MCLSKFNLKGNSIPLFHNRFVFHGHCVSTCYSHKPNQNVIAVSFSKSSKNRILIFSFPIGLVSSPLPQKKSFCAFNLLQISFLFFSMVLEFFASLNLAMLSVYMQTTRAKNCCFNYAEEFFQSVNLKCLLPWGLLKKRVRQHDLLPYYFVMKHLTLLNFKNWLHENQNQNQNPNIV